MTRIYCALAVIIGLGACAPDKVFGPPAPAAGHLAVAKEDLPYFVHGPVYVSHGQRYVWVSGHWDNRHGKRVWVHGHYRWYVGIGD